MHRLSIAFCGLLTLSACQSALSQVEDSPVSKSKPITDSLEPSSQKTEVRDEQIQLEPPKVSYVYLQYAHAKEVEVALGKLFAPYVRSEAFVVVADTRLNRLLLRFNATDELHLKVMRIITDMDAPDELSINESEREQSNQQKRPADQVNPQPPKAPNGLRRESLSMDPSNGLPVKPASPLKRSDRLSKDFFDAKADPAKQQSLREAIVSAVEEEFLQSQNDLEEELVTLKNRLTKLEAALQQRHTAKDKLCREKVESLLAAGTITNNSLVARPRSQQPPFQSNLINVAGERPDGITTLIGGEIECPFVVRLTADSYKSWNGDGSSYFEVSNLQKVVRFEVDQPLGVEPITVAIQMACQDAPTEFWNRVRGKHISVNVSPDVIERVKSNGLEDGLVVEALYLPKDKDTIESLFLHELEPGENWPRKVKSLGQPIIYATFTSKGKDNP